MKKLFVLPLIIYATASCQEYEEYNEITEKINDVIDFILNVTQKAIQSITYVILKHIRFYNTSLLVKEPDDGEMLTTHYNLYKYIKSTLDCDKVEDIEDITKETLDKWMDDTRISITILEDEIIILQNSIDRLVMNGSANFTAKCEIYTDVQFILCLEKSVDEVKDISETLLARLSDTISNFRFTTC